MEYRSRIQVCDHLSHSLSVEMIVGDTKPFDIKSDNSRMSLNTA